MVIIVTRSSGRGCGCGRVLEDLAGGVRVQVSQLRKRNCLSTSTDARDVALAPIRLIYLTV